MHNDIPAFPLSIEKEHFISLGMTLKDYYAGQALMGYLSNGASMDSAVHWSWQAAEKMLKKREEFKNKI
jgi:hypothetical protein